MKITKFKFLVFLFFLGLFLYYWGQPHPFERFKNDISGLFNTEKKKAKEPWTREGRGDTEASDTKSNEDVASDTRKPPKDRSIVDILKDAVEEGKSVLPSPSGGTSERIEGLEQFIPSAKNNTEIVRHTAFMLSYQEEYEQASWVLHILKQEASEGTEPRSNEFMADPKVQSGSAVSQDYSRSGYDRGHLCPAGDFKYDKALQDETFYMSNMSPQAPDFNRGIWSDLESRVRKWAKERGDLVIVTGPILSEGLSYIGKRNQVAVPEYYYKIVYDPNAQQAIAFLMPNEGSHALIKSFAVSIDELEKKTGIDFFAKLPDSVEKKIESRVSIDDWF